MALGAIRFRSLSFSAAGVFFLALVAGHYQHVIPPALTEFGLVLFVYSVGLQSGSRFFRVLRSHGWVCVGVAASATLTGAAVAYVLARGLGLSPALAAGLFSGGTTCTPALAAVLEALNRLSPDAAPLAAVGYAVGYPFSVIACVLAIQLLPRLTRTTVTRAAEEYRRGLADLAPALERCAFRVTNPNCAGVTVAELKALRMTDAVICRVEHDGVSVPARPDTVMHMGDVAVTVGLPQELAKLETIIGTIAPEPPLDPAGPIASELIVVSRRTVFGRRIRDLHLWETHGVTATRLRRGDTEMTPHGDTVLEPGDVLRLVGARADVAAVAQLIGREERRLDETSMIPFAAGIALGAAVGRIPIPAPGGLHFQLGIGGGAFLVALVIGHLGHVGPLRIYVPNAAKHFARELGIVIFLAGAGTVAGQHFVSILREVGYALFLYAALVTLATLATALLVMRLAFRWNILYAAGSLSAIMTSPPGLTAASEMTDIDAPAVGFASVYPIALIIKIALAPLLYLVLAQ